MHCRDYIAVLIVHVGGVTTHAITEALYVNIAKHICIMSNKDISFPVYVCYRIPIKLKMMTIYT